MWPTTFGNTPPLSDLFVAFGTLSIMLMILLAAARPLAKELRLGATCPRAL